MEKDLPSSSSGHYTPLRRDYDGAAEPEEIKGLLESETHPDSFVDAPEDIFARQRKPSWKRSVGLGSLLALVLLGVYSGAVVYRKSQALIRAKALHFEGDELRSNGTHEFRRTVLLVSIDGLRSVALYLLLRGGVLMGCRADYLDRGFTPHLLDIAKQGLRAKYMKPIFPVRVLYDLCLCIMLTELCRH